MKEEGKLGLGEQGDGAAWLAEVPQMMDFNLKRLAYRARNRKLEGVRIEAGTLIVTPLASEVPAAAEDLNVEISDMYPLVEVPDLLREVHEWTGFADQFTHVRTGDTPQNISAMLARAAQGCVTDAHARHPHSRLWADGTTASSDGQFFRASDRAAKRLDLFGPLVDSDRLLGDLFQQIAAFLAHQLRQVAVWLVQHLLNTLEVVKTPADWPYS